ncbi:MAG: hypothetical protein ACJAV5_000615 [Vicingaceae bacterium]|jgi:hypothetical protein
MKKVTLTLVLISFVMFLFGQNATNIQVQWKMPIQYGFEGQLNKKALTFEDAQYDFSVSNVPFLVKEFEGQELINIRLENVTSELLTLTEADLIDKSQLSNVFKVESSIVTIKKKRSTVLKLFPLRLVNGQVEKLISCDINFSSGEKTAANREKSLSYASQSKLANGNWYKIAVTEKKVFKLTRSFLSNLGLDVESLDPRKIKIYGYGGGMLPESNAAERSDDLVENSIVVVGEQDGTFDANDYVLFYGDDQVEWTYDSTSQFFRHSLNRFSDTTFYFVNAEGANGKRVNTKGVSSNPSFATVTEFDSYSYHELELSNLLKSGSLWIGELFDNTTNLSVAINASNTVVSEKAKVEMSVLARSGVTSKFTLSVNGESFEIEVGSTNLTRYEFRFAQAARNMFEFTPSQGALSFDINYNKPQVVSKGWLNYLTINLRSRIAMVGNQTAFRDIRSVVVNGTSSAEAVFQFPNTANLKVWDVTDAQNAEAMTVQNNGNTSAFQNDVTELKEYIAFISPDSVGVFSKGKIATQNLHGLPQADMLIISHEKFLTAADRLANIHRSEGLLVNVVTAKQIFNEFSSGSQDLIAMRTFIKMFYDRASGLGTPPKYVLMMGDASYVFKNASSGGTNYVPSFQSTNSVDPVNSHVSDDYFGLLDDTEGLWRVPSLDRMDVAIGRFPVQTLQEADGIVDKVESYYSSATFKDWRNKIVFVGDDEDGVVHMSQADDLSKLVDLKGKDFNTEKIYLDAYQQQSTASGARYPEVTDDLVQTVEDGALFVNYTGHGGETGWTSERILGIYEITNWKNRQNLPVFVTATCEFSRFDDPLRTSGGELLLLNPNGGAIGLMTTTRLVFSSPNYLLNRSFYDKVFEPRPNNEPMRLGDIFLEVKNFNAYSTNSRNFSLLGDPAIRLAIPKENVLTTTINGIPLAQADTLNALSQVTIAGIVADANGNKISNFNGFVYPTVFDKIETKSTLNNDGGGVFTFKTRERRIFKGKATVSNGDFTFTFVVPKDISYSYGSGKISYYAENQSTDANGYSEEIMIGGSNPNLVQDEEGPQMELFLNDENFVYGGVTDENPRLLLNLRDNQGINTVGSGIGHDIVATLDGNSENSFILNDYYEAAVDDHTQGVVSFPFTDLSPGKHALKVKAWDVANNSSEKTIEFTVVKDQEVRIENLVNYPNPFTTNTEFIFQHNQSGVVMDVKLEVYTISGKLVKSIDKMIVNDGFVSKDIRWDGKDDFGDRIGKGVYMYKLQVRSANGSASEKIEKLVIL